VVLLGAAKLTDLSAKKLREGELVLEESHNELVVCAVQIVEDPRVEKLEQAQALSRVASLSRHVLQQAEAPVHDNPELFLSLLCVP
jgi:hypothetical protein